MKEHSIFSGMDFIAHYEDELIAIFYNPDGNNGRGLFEEHHFPMHIVLLKYLESEIDIYESLFEDAYNCPTFLIDNGTTEYNDVIERLIYTGLFHAVEDFESYVKDIAINYMKELLRKI